MRQWMHDNLQQSHNLYTYGSSFSSEGMRISDALGNIVDKEWEFNSEWYDRDDNKEYHIELILEMARQAEELHRRLDSFVQSCTYPYNSLGFALPDNLPELDGLYHHQIGWTWLDTALILLQNPIAQAQILWPTADEGDDPTDHQERECRQVVCLFRRLSRGKQRALMSWAFQFYEDFHTLYTAYNAVFGLLEKMRENNISVKE